jgi:small subunit ribosomal protein S21e
MQNEAGENVDLYIPRKCSWTNRLVRAKDHTSVQINVAQVDPMTGLATGSYTPYAIAGYVRFKSESDVALTTLVQKTDVNLWNLQTAEATPVAAAAVMTSSE